MAAGNWIMYGAALESIFNAGIDCDGDTFRMILVTSSYTPAQNTHSTYADVSANEATGTGYTQYGELTNVAVSRTNNVVTVDTEDETWASSTITAKYAVIVRDADANGTIASTDLLLAYLDLDTGGGSLSSSAGAFNVNANASGIFTATAATS